MLETFAPSRAPVVPIKAIQFGLLSPEEIKAFSVVEVQHAETFEKGVRKAKGLVDPAMGLVDNNPRNLCKTCATKNEECPGHFGHIELAHPVFHAGYLGRIKKLLEIFCYHCSHLRVRSATSKDRYAAFLRCPKARRFADAWTYGKARPVCERDECGRQLLPIRKMGLSLQIDGKAASGSLGADKNLLDPENVLRIFSAISDEECRLIGLDPVLARPEWMIQVRIPVPPPSVRPSLNMETCGRAEDDLTHKLGDIIKHNNVAGDPNALAKAQVESRELVQYHAATYLDNHISGVPTALLKNRPLKSIKSRLKGKEGRLRNNLNGKRVEQSARTVITGDPNIAIDEVGCPLSIAKNLTFSETVTPWNKHLLERAVANRRAIYPGANYVIKGNVKYDLRFGTRKMELNVGDKVERHLVDGDIVIFNRQPSLHKFSMMGHRLKVMPYSTFRLNLSCTTPYNADFDGDEMNLHVPQNRVARAEIETLAMVPAMIVSPQSNKPIMGIVQDPLLGGSLLTQRDAFLGYEEAAALVMHIAPYIQREGLLLPPPAILRPKPLWTGKQIFSLLLPYTLEYTGFHSGHPTDEAGYSSAGDSRVIITGGDVVCGILCKRTLGTSGGGLIHLLWQDYGLHVVSGFMNGCQQLANNWLFHNGFSVGIGDATISAAGVAEIRRVVEDACGAGDEINDTEESEMARRLAQARDSAGKIAQRSLVWKNNFQSMVTGGSKGSSINISQITACVGQQNVEGKRIPFLFEDRTLPHFRRFDNSAAARGFVRHSYFQGLKPAEFFFHAMGGREGLIDTAVKTAETGYIQRRLVKAVEDIRVAYDGTVRNGRGDVIQFAYGEDGLDGTAIEKQVLVSISQSDEGLEDKFSEDPEELSVLKQDRNMLLKLFPGVEDTIALPVNLKRMLLFATNRFPLRLEDQPVHASFEKLRQLEMKWRQGFVGTRSNVDLFCAHMRSVLASKRLRSQKVSETAFSWLLNEIDRKYARAIVDPGTMVGVLAAQCIGEPATQMTLNTFHLAGIASKKVTLGIPRLKELIDNARTLKSPTMTLHLTPEFLQGTPEHLSGRLRQLKASIEHVNLKDLVAEVTIVYDPNPFETHNEEDRAWLSLLMEIPDDTRPDPSSLSRWMMRITINRNKMWTHCLSMDQIGECLQKTLGDDGWTVWSDDNDDHLVLHVRLFDEDEKSVPMNVYFAQIKEPLLESVTLKGIRGVTGAEVEHVAVRQTNGASNELGKETIIETAGINLSEMCEVEGIDPTRMTCNSPREVLEFLGVEAARATYLAEIRKVIEFDGSYINLRHLSLLGDLVTQTGVLMSITRHGINRCQSSPLTKASFEETVDMLLNAGMDAEREDLKGVSPSLILGQFPKAGTGTFDLVLDEAKLSAQPEEVFEEEYMNWADAV